MRILVASFLGVAFGIFGFTAGMGLTGTWLAAAPIGLLVAVASGVWMFRRPIVPLDASCPQSLKVVGCLAAVLALVVLARLSVFMVAPVQVGYSSVPSSKWETRHCCLTAYFVAGKAASSQPNVYADSLYTARDDDPTKIRKPLKMGAFDVDVYEYPPPFLLLPRALHHLTPDFLRLRMLWFAICGGVVLLSMLLVARMLGPSAGTRALLLSPLVFAALPTLSVLQKGNVQVLIIAAAMLAMVLFERRRWAAGGVLLAFVTLSKLYPGMLVVYLIARREWRALVWTAAAGAVLLVASFLDVGSATYRAFFDRLPAILGGEAFPAFRNPMATAINFSVPGLVFKLKLFGVPGMSFAASKIVGWLYTIVVVWVTYLAGRRALRDSEKPLVWLAILTLATLRSPFLPQAYAAFPPLWLLTLLAATYPPSARVLACTLLGWAALNVFWPLDWAMDPRALAAANLVPQVVTIAVAVLALRRTMTEADERAVGATDRAALAPMMKMVTNDR